VLAARTAEEQAAIHREYIDPFFDNFAFALIGRLPVTMFGLGIPPQQFEDLKKELIDGTIIDIYRERVRRLACDFPIADNYFAWQAFARRYDTEKRMAVPEYLKEENYERLRARAGKLLTEISSVTDAIERSPYGTFDRFVLLDAQDWMDAAAITELWQKIAEKAEAGARIVFRTAGSNSPVESSLPEALLARFKYERELSRDLFKKDRSSIYGGFHLYTLTS
jgi:S-adenosylmethionine-diacylglycerol 3-amino-3-carboxypropyl transferase